MRKKGRITSVRKQASGKENKRKKERKGIGVGKKQKIE